MNEIMEVNSQTKYRIFQIGVDLFFIQKKVTTIRGILLWKKEIEDWIPLNEFGYPCYAINIDPPATYTSLGSAQAALQFFIRGPIIYKIGK